MAVFILRTHYQSGRTWANICSLSGYASQVKIRAQDALCGRLVELSFEIRLERRTTKGSLSGHIMRLVPVFILETHNQTNNKMFAQVRPKFG